MPGLPAPYGDAVAKMDRSFFTTALVPATVFLTAYGAVLIASFWSFGEATDWWSERATAVQLAAALVTSAGVWFIAGLFSSNWRRIVRLYEGYPFSRLLPEANEDPESQERRRMWMRRLPGFAWHLERMRRLENGEVRGGLTTLYYRYPSPRFDYQTLPTTIGNVLLSAERYGLDRYGLDPTVLWPRLFWCLPEPVQSALERFKEEHQLPLALSFISAVFTGASAITLLLSADSWQVLAWVSGLGLLLSLGTYWLAVERTEEYAEQLRTAIDLYHQELKNRWPEPCKEASQADWFARARDFVLKGTDADCGPDRRGGITDADVVGGRTADRALVVPGRQRRTGKPAVKDQASLPSVSHPRTKLERLAERWEDLVCLLRPMPVIAVVGAGTIMVASTILYRHSTEVLVAVRSADPGDILAVETKQMPTRKVPSDATPASERKERLYATAPIESGTVLRSAVASSATSVLRVTLPVTDGTSPSTPPVKRTGNALIAPCGVVLNRATITNWENASTGLVTTLLIASDEAAKLRGCRAESVTVLIPPG